jgi:hypothetical protein
MLYRQIHLKAKHINIRCNFIRNDIIKAERLEVVHILKKKQPADILTKQLSIDQFKAMLQIFDVKKAETHK